MVRGREIEIAGQFVTGVIADMLGGLANTIEKPFRQQSNVMEGRRRHEVLIVNVRTGMTDA